MHQWSFVETEVVPVKRLQIDSIRISIKIIQPHVLSGISLRRHQIYRKKDEYAPGAEDRREVGLRGRAHSTACHQSAQRVLHNTSLHY